MIEAPDLNLIVYVVKIQPHTTVHSMYIDGTYYLAEMKEDNNDVIMLYGTAVCYTNDIALATIFEHAEDAKQAGKKMEGTQTIRTSVHPVSRKIFFEASLRGIR